MTEKTNGDSLTVGVEQESVVVSFDQEGGSKVSTTGDSLKQEYDGAGDLLSPEDIADLEADTGEGEEGEGSKDGEEGTDKEGEESSEGDTAELPEWDPADEDVSSKYDAKYITKDEDGSEVLNFEAFNEEFALDRGEGKRDLNPSTRKYLKDRFGISDKLIDTHLQGVIAQEREMANSFYSNFAADPVEGEKVFDAMLAWAKAEGGYSAEQKARYNEAMQAGGQAAQDQIELLKTRYLTKNGGKLPTSEPGSKPGIGLKRKERGVSPPKNATGQASGSGKTAQPFANAEEHRIAQNEALRLKGKERDAKLAEVRTRLQASTFWRA